MRPVPTRRIVLLMNRCDRRAARRFNRELTFAAKSEVTRRANEPIKMLWSCCCLGMSSERAAAKELENLKR